MIEKMNLCHVVSVEAKKREMLLALRDLGVLHISEKNMPDEAISNRFAALQKLSLELADYASKEKTDEKILDDVDFEELFNETKKAIERKNVLEETRTAKLLEIEKIKAWGDFSPSEVRKLQNSGIDLHFYRVDKKEIKKLAESENVKFIRLASVDKMDTVAVIGKLQNSASATEFLLPERGIGELQSEIKLCEEEISYLEGTLIKSANQLESYKNQLIKTQNAAEFSSVSNTAKSSEGLVWLKGYVPISETENFKNCAVKNGWAYSIETVEVDDGSVPTKVKYNKLTALMKPIFDILGTVPGYGEYDISFWFLAFFALFFAMIIGDAGYGAIFLIGAIAIVGKMKKFNNATLLLTVLSVATIIWGAMTGTWFGMESAMKVPFLKSLVIPSFANYPQYFGLESASVQNSVMKFCFSIGAIQLVLACLMNIRRKITTKDLSLFADIGWLVAICALYFLVLFLVIGQKIDVKTVGVIVGVGFVLVVLFGGMSPDKTFAQGLKAGLADIFTTFLNTISAFGNVMSYIRLFAVGMASLAIAQSFNNMSAGFSGPLVIVGAVIAILGHVINIVMGFLSVVVHGVRLNLLEFSGQLGMEWSGTAYEPFSESKTLKK
ncbi:MAG: hypothetical protein MJ090_00085 [Clostridia bacterium]|nr:hypothetical protein [Clostridia bacterium]